MEKPPSFNYADAEARSHDSELVCAICDEYLWDPLVLTSCEHPFCRPCISQWFQTAGSGLTCPTCRVTVPNDIDALKAPPAILTKMLNKLRIYCLNKSRGCPWVGARPDLGAHLVGCTFRRTTCAHRVEFGCSWEGINQDYAAHLTVEKCPGVKAIAARKEAEAVRSANQTLLRQVSGQPVRLNVGGEYLSTTLQTLTRYPASLLGALFGDKQLWSVADDGSVFLDRDPQPFKILLSFLRNQTLPTEPNELSLLEREAAFWRIPLPKRPESDVVDQNQDSGVVFLNCRVLEKEDETLKTTRWGVQKIPTRRIITLKFVTKQPKASLCKYGFLQPVSDDFVLDVGSEKMMDALLFLISNGEVHFPDTTPLNGLLSGIGLRLQ